MDITRPAHEPAVTIAPPTSPARRAHGTPVAVLEESPDGGASRIAERLDRRRPPAVYPLTALLGYLCLVGAAIGLGALLTQVILAGNARSADDEHVSSWFARERTPRLDDLTYAGSLIGDIPVLPDLVVIAVVVFLCLRPYLAAAFIAASSPSTAPRSTPRSSGWRAA